MSDLAPFVAAVLRDQVVGELHDENKALKSQVQRLQRTLHEHNPLRSVKVTGPNGAQVVKEGCLNAERAMLKMQFRLFQEVGQESVRLRDLLLLELWIHGGCAVRFPDLPFHYSRYSCKKTREEQFQYMATIVAQDTAGVDNIGLRLELLIVLPPEDHARLLQRDSIVEFTPQENLDDCLLGIVEPGAEEEIPISRLLEDWCPTSPTVCRDQGLVEKYYWSTEALS